MAEKNSNSLVGTTGEYLVCAELGKKGVLAVLTPKNNPLFDIVAISKDAQKSIAIQVKTMSEHNKQGWKFTKFDKEQNNPKLFVVLVNILVENADFYIYEHDELTKRVEEEYQKYIEKPKRNGEPRKDVGFRWFDLVNFTENDKSKKNNWKILGF